MTRYNDFLTLEGIPPETFDYRLGNRSALDWVIDQYQVSTDKRSGITNDPNRPDDPQYIVRLIAEVVPVSLETVKTVKALPPRSVAAAWQDPAPTKRPATTGAVVASTIGTDRSTGSRVAVQDKQSKSAQSKRPRS